MMVFTGMLDRLRGTRTASGGDRPGRVTRSIPADPGCGGGTSPAPSDAQGERLARLAEASTDFIGIADVAGYAVYINAGGRRLLGLRPDEDIRGRPIRSFSPPWAADRILNAGIPAALDCGSWEGDTALLHVDGTEIPVSQLILAHYGSDGTVDSLSTVARDIRARKAFELELRNTLDQLRAAQQQVLQSEKLAAIGQLAAGVAHEINNPVGYVQSNLMTLRDYVERLDRIFDLAGELQDALPESSELRGRWEQAIVADDLAYLRRDLPDLLEESLEGVERVRRIVLDLRDFSRVDAPEWESTDLHRGLESTLNVAANELKYKCALVRDYGDLPPVECLGSQINQVFLNLLLNAAQAIENRGEVRISTGVCPGGGRVWVEISDDGPGMTETMQSRIFEPFFTTKPPGQGTGLGLPLAYRIIERHGGALTVRSRPGEGSCFRIELPTRQNGATDDAPETAR